MKKGILSILILGLLLCGAAWAEGLSAFEVLPVPEPNPESPFGCDINVNMQTIDEYLGLEDAVYRDMRMAVDPYDYDAIGGSSIASGMIEGFTLVSFPKLAPCRDMPEALGQGYAGPTLFGIDENGRYVPNYEESMAILEAIFPKDQAIILMCGAGGYAGMTREMLVSLGWDGGMIINAGGFWEYTGEHAAQTTLKEPVPGLEHFSALDFFDYDFTHLTPIQ